MKVTELIRQCTVDGTVYRYYSLAALANLGLESYRVLPVSLKILLENRVRNHKGAASALRPVLSAMAKWVKQGGKVHFDLPYSPARVLMQDLTGVPAVVDLAAMRDAMAALGGDVQRINPLRPVDLVIDHSVQVDRFGGAAAFKDNVTIEMQRNYERYAFLKWGQSAFSHFRVVPPGMGICHQFNLEYLAEVVWCDEDGMLFPDTLVGTDSHTTMINGLGVLGWGVGGIEAEAAMLGQPISMLLPEVIGVKMTHRLNEGITATDLVLHVTALLRRHGVVGKFVEFFGEGVTHLSLSERATIANMAPEYGATCGFFPIDEETLSYLHLTGREQSHIDRVEAYAKLQGLWHTPAAYRDTVFTEVLTVDLSEVVPTLAGPKRPQDKVTLSGLPAAMRQVCAARNTSFPVSLSAFAQKEQEGQAHLPAQGAERTYRELQNGDVVIAAITSCTNTSNPRVLMMAALLAKAAVERGLTLPPWVKASLAPGSRVVMAYLEQAKLLPYLEKLGFYLVGFGCTTCIGNSGPLPEAIDRTIEEKEWVVCSVLSGNRNFEGRIHPRVKANWLASPPLVVAFALAGTMCVDLSQEALGQDQQGQPVYLKDIWPDARAVDAAVSVVNQTMFRSQYVGIMDGTPEWQAIDVAHSDTYAWQADSTYIRHPRFFSDMQRQPLPVADIVDARILAVLGDSITTDHISPAGTIAADSPAAQYLQAQGVPLAQFNTYGTRRGNHEVMVRGTFANIRIRNEMVPGSEGGMTCYQGETQPRSIYEVAMRYQANNIPLVVVAGKEYGTGSSRDWAAKGTRLLGVKAVIAESYERIHRSNLIGMGVLPLAFLPGENRHTLALTGHETLSITGIAQGMTPKMRVDLQIGYPDGSARCTQLLCRIDTEKEAAYYMHSGILPYVLRGLLA